MDLAVQLRMPSRGSFGSGRCVQMRMLTSPEYETVQIEAATEVGPGGTVAAHQITRKRRGILAALTHVSEPDIPRDRKMADVELVPITISELMKPGGPRNLYELFNAKEIELLGYQFGQLHEPSVGDVADSEGNVVSVPRV